MSKKYSNALQMSFYDAWMWLIAPFLDTDHLRLRRHKTDSTNFKIGSKRTFSRPAIH